MPPPPCPFLSCPALHTDTHRALARAGSLLLRTVVGPTPARRYLPPCCLQHVPSAHARRLKQLQPAVLIYCQMPY